GPAPARRPLRPPSRPRRPRAPPRRQPPCRRLGLPPPPALRMTTSLRLRLLAIVLAAALVPIAPLAIVLLLQVRDALYARRVADARARIAAASVAARESCGGQRGCAEHIALAAGGRVVPAPCAS